MDTIPPRSCILALPQAAHRNKLIDHQRVAQARVTDASNHLVSNFLKSLFSSLFSLKMSVMSSIPVVRALGQSSCSFWCQRAFREDVAARFCRWDIHKMAGRPPELLRPGPTLRQRCCDERLAYVRIFRLLCADKKAQVSSAK